MKSTLALVAVLWTLAPATASAMPVELRDGEIALGVSDRLRIDAMVLFETLGVPLTVSGHVSTEAEGGGLAIGLRPVLARIDDARIIWASRGGPVLYGLGGVSFGLEAVTELQVVFGEETLRCALTPRLDVAAAFGDQVGARVRPMLALAIGIVEPVVAAWIEGELGYTFGGEGAGAFHLGASLVVGFRPGVLR